MTTTSTFDTTARPAVDTAHGPHGQRSDVLLVEDDDLVRYALRRLLVGCHRPCLATSSVEEAQQLLAGHEPSLVLTDYNLGGRWTGIDLLVWMRRSARLREIPSLLMTGDDPTEIRARLAAVGLGDIGVIAKPFEAAELLETLARLRRGPAQGAF